MPIKSVLSAIDLSLLSTGYLGYVSGQLMQTQDVPRLPLLSQWLTRAEPALYLQQLKVLLALCRILEWAHSAGVVHRSLRPEVIYLSESGEVFVGGWEDNQPPFHGYLPPELARRSAEADARSDLFSLGAIWYHWLTGRRPFEGETYLALLHSMLTKAPAPPGPPCPGCLSSLCMRLLVINQEERPASVLVVTALLEEALTEAQRDSLALADTPFFAEDAHPTPEAKGAEQATKVPLSLVSPDMYQVAGELARGGLGRILQARDARLQRPVALKEILRDQGEARQRFLREAYITAKLQHPGIVPIYEVGRWPTGELFYSMKLVKGQPLSALIQQAKTLPDRLALLPRVFAASEAIAYAHAEGILHRDLKPHNIMVGDFGETLVIDWGIAKRLSDKEIPGEAGPYRGQTTEQTLTMQGSILGTPAYMPLEQAQGKKVDERADVYALGAILYHLLSGKPPYQEKNANAALVRVLQEEPAPLSAQQVGIPVDLLAIVEKAMSRDADARYPSAKELSEDLRKFQTGQIVGAYQYTRTELLRRWLKKHRLAVSAALLAFVAAAAVIFWDVQRLEGALAKTTKQKNIAQVAQKEAEEAKAKAEEERIRAIQQSDEAKLAQARLLLESAPWRSLEVLSTLSPGFARYSAARVIAADALSRGIPKLFKGHTSYISTMAFSPDGALLASAGGDQTVRIWNVGSGRERSVLHGHAKEVYCVIFSPDGRQLASSDAAGGIWLWDLTTQKGQALKGHTDFVNSVSFSPDGKRLFSGSGDHTIRIWDLETKEAKVLEGHTAYIHKTFLSPDGKTLASASGDGSLRVWDVNTGEGQILGNERESLRAVAFSPDGSLLAAASSLNSPLYLWELNTKKRQTLPSTARSWITLAFSPDGKVVFGLSSTKEMIAWDLATKEERIISTSASQSYSSNKSIYADEKNLVFSGEGGILHIWDRERQAGRSLQGHEGNIVSFCVSPNDQLVASAGQDGVILVRSLAPPGERVLGAHQTSRSLDFSRNGAYLASSTEGALKIWDLKTDKDLIFNGNHKVSFGSVFSPDGRLLAAGSRNNVLLYDLENNTYQELTGHSSFVRLLVFAKDGGSLASADNDYVIRLWSPNGKAMRELKGHKEYIRKIVFSPDGKWLASASYDKTVRLWEVATGKSHILTEHKSIVHDVEFSSDGTLVASCSSDGSIILWRLIKSSSTPPSFLQRLKGFEGDFFDLAFSPDDRTLVVGTNLGSVRLWDLQTGQERVLYAHERAVWYVVFSPDGGRLASANVDGSVRLWDIKNWQTAPSIESRFLRGHQKMITSILFSPDGTLLASASLDGPIRIFADDLPHHPSDLRSWLQHITHP